MPKMYKNFSHNANDIDNVRITVASPEQIKSWGYGEVKKPETINYRTFKPEKDGLFCAQIFGPIRDYECLCGKYKRIKYKGVVCEKCGVEVTSASTRRDRLGWIELAAPVAHIWFLKSLPSKIASVLSMSLKDVEKVIYYEKYVLTDPGITDLQKGQLLTEEEYEELYEEHGPGSFEAEMGAGGIRSILKEIDLKQELQVCQKELEQTKAVIKRDKIMRSIKVIKSLLKAGIKPEWMILTILPVLPADLRPLVALDGGRFAASDLNDLYRRIINRNNRLIRLIDLQAPDIIIRNEKRMLQSAVDALFDNGKKNKPVLASNNRPLKSLSEFLKGKQGRFRQNLLGKRVDYSGRSVIVVGPKLRLNQCGLPKKMALELMKPFVYSKLIKYDLAITVKNAKKMVERGVPEVWDILEELIDGHPVLLNRAPTLHRLGIQAFEPILIEGKAIQLHPLVCNAFNADFDGDQMAVHVPLSIEAQTEARVLMMSTNNLLSPSTGKPIVVPTKDMVIGLYYLTLMREKDKNKKEKVFLFSSFDEAVHAHEQKLIHIQDEIIIRYDYIGSDGKPSYGKATSTLGRMILWNITPRHKDILFEDFNIQVNAAESITLIEKVYKICGPEEAVDFVDNFMDLGMNYSTYSGVSFSKNDLKIPETKEKVVKSAKKQVLMFEKQYKDGLITQKEKYNKVIDVWSKCSEEVADDMMKCFVSDHKSNSNSIFMMHDSGARGTVSQMKQLAGMRGLMAKSSGEIMEMPILSNFKEGLTVLEYFNSTHGSRKGLTDMALKTANSGYLTRRLVDVAQDCIVTQEDCKTDEGITVRRVFDGSEAIADIAERLTGRILQKDLLDPKTGGRLFYKGTIIDEAKAISIRDSNIAEVKVRSVITCKVKNGVCAKCYGVDLSKEKIVKVGEAVGVIAAQSIGEPGTQLTMRTKHLGGIAQTSGQKFNVESQVAGKLKVDAKLIATNSDDEIIIVKRNSEIIVVGDKGEIKYKAPYGAKLLCQPGEKVEIGQIILEWDPYSVPVISDTDGEVNYQDLLTGISLEEVEDKETGSIARVVSDWNQKAPSLVPLICVTEKGNKNDDKKRANIGDKGTYVVNPGSILVMPDKSKIKKGDILIKIPKESSKTKDITGGLPRVSELLEVRTVKDPAVLAQVDGIVSIQFTSKIKNKIIINDKDGNKLFETSVPKWKSILVQEGDHVIKGDLLVDGNFVLNDILQTLGINVLIEYMIKEIQTIYRMQGIGINDKHMEVIIKQMLRKVEITDNADSEHHMVGEQMGKYEFEQYNEQAIKAGKKQMTSKPLLQGITRASLNNDSFISAASFQETTRVLTNAAIEGKVDNLVGLKENVMVGKLIPAGTGYIYDQMKKEAIKRDEIILAGDKIGKEPVMVDEVG